MSKRFSLKERRDIVARYEQKIAYFDARAAEAEAQLKAAGPAGSEHYLRRRNEARESAARWRSELDGARVQLEREERRAARQAEDAAELRRGGQAAMLGAVPAVAPEKERGFNSVRMVPERPKKRGKRNA